MRSKERDKLLTDKLNFIVEDYITGGAEELAIKTFGYERQNAVSNLCSYRAKSAIIRKVHMEAIEKHHQIPMSIWSRHVPLDTELLDKMIKEYRDALKKDIEPIVTNDSIFKRNERLFNKLKGVWYAYLYPSNLKSTPDGIWVVRTVIHDDYSVVDYWDNRGYLRLGKHESLIIKELYDNDDLTVIRFSNRQVPSQHFRFTIVSNQNNTSHEMVNFGFYSRKKYTPKEAKEILGDISKAQLKLDLDFNNRLNRQGVVPME